MCLRACVCAPARAPCKVRFSALCNDSVKIVFKVRFRHLLLNLFVGCPLAVYLLPPVLSCGQARFHEELKFGNCGVIGVRCCLWWWKEMALIIINYCVISQTVAPPRHPNFILVSFRPCHFATMLLCRQANLEEVDCLATYYGVTSIWGCLS